MTAPSPARPAAAGAAADPTGRRGRLALALQEPLTTIARLRANKQVANDAESFRVRIKQVLAAAEQDARAMGYDASFVQFALFAVIAFLDETVLNSNQPMFAGWAGRPLQQEIFTVHMAGELFYQYLQQLLEQPDSPDLADVLEVFELCLLMGFKGRLSGTDGGDVQGLIQRLSAKIQRVRGAMGELSPRWRPTQGDIGRRRDRWVPRLLALAVVLVVAAVGLYAYFAFSLHAGVGDLAAVNARLPH